jgi:hypothetical protein
MYTMTPTTTPDPIRNPAETTAGDARGCKVDRQAERLLAGAVEAARLTKESIVAEAGRRENDVMAPVVVLFRYGKPVATGRCTQVSRDDALELAFYGVQVFGADAVELWNDSTYTTSPTNPVTGRPWRRGEMQSLCNTLACRETGLVTDMIFIARFERDGRWFSASLPYHPHHSAKGRPGTVVWSEDPQHVVFMSGRTPGKRQLLGLVPDTIRDAFTHAAKNQLDRATRAQADRHFAAAFCAGGEGRWSIALTADEGEPPRSSR